MLNIGVRPSIKDSFFSIEVHLFNFHESIYGKEIAIEFIRRIRDEKKFPNLESLKDQLILDEKECKDLFKI